MRVIFRRLLAAVFVVLAIPGTALADLKVSSWNLMHLGWGDEKNYQEVADIMQRFDIIAVQEVMSESALHKVVDTLNATTHDHWRYLASHAIGRGSYKELYGIIYRTEAVEYESGAVVYIDSRDVFAREPFSARFHNKRDGGSFALATVHILYGKSEADRAPEIKALASYWQWLQETYGGVPVMLMGDFNFAPDSTAFSALRRVGAAPTITSGKSTLSPHNGRFASLYDNIWVTPGRLTLGEHGIVNYPKLLGIDHVTARKTVSDHAPVYVVLKDTNAGAAPTQKPAAAAAPVTSGQRDCIDLNQSSAQRLADLPHIGVKRAELIVAGRPWQSVGELVRIRGIGEKSAHDIAAYSGLCAQ